MRKAWRVDIKWISGILFTISCFIILILIYFLSLNAIDTPAFPGKNQGQAPENMFFPLSGSNNPVTEVFNQAKERPDDYLEIKGIGRLDIKGKDINGLNTAAVTAKITQSVDRKIKRMSTEQRNKMATDLTKELSNSASPDMIEQFQDNPAKAMSTHIDQAQNPFMASPLMFLGTISRTIFIVFLSIISIFGFLALIGLVFSSYRSGKLSSPGLGLMLASIPGTIGYILGKSFFGLTQQSQLTPAELTPPTSIYTSLFDKGIVFPIAFGIGLMLIFVGSIVGLIMQARKPKPVSEPSPKQIKSEAPTKIVEKPKTKKKSTKKKKK